MRKIFLTGLIIFILAISNFVFAAKIPAAPTENIYVADYAAMIDDATKNQILAIGGELDKKYKAQIVVVTLDNLGGSSIEEYANELFNSWGIGDKDLNNGVLILIAKNERRFRIEVGYGLEGAITDGYAGEVLDGMTNYFRTGDYSTGILQAYSELTRKTYEEYGGEVPENLYIEKPAEEESLLDMFLGFLIVVIFLAALYFFLKYVFILPIAISVYIVSAIVYFVTRRKYGTLSFSSIYAPMSEFMSFKNFFGGSGSSKSSGSGRSGGRSGGGFGGGRSGGGGASGGW